MIIALIGADGQLGSDLARLIPSENLHPLYYPEFDVTRPSSAETIRRLGPDVVINTSAFHRVDECEGRIEEAFRVNAFAVRDLASTCRDLGAALVHFSTDYVFDGRKRAPYREEDPPGPLSAYAASKLAGEYFIRSIWKRHFIVRTCGLYGRAGCLEKGRNFVETMLFLAAQKKTIRVVSDQRMTPTPTLELARNVLALMESGAYGLYHMTGEGECSWYDFALAIFEEAGLEADLQAVDSASFGARARRPAYSVLENVRAKALGLPGFSPWREGLKAFFAEKNGRAEG